MDVQFDFKVPVGILKIRRGEVSHSGGSIFVECLLCARHSSGCCSWSSEIKQILPPGVIGEFFQKHNNSGISRK